MNILLMKFNEGNKKFVEDALRNTKFRESILFEASNVREAQKSSNWGNIDLIMYYSSSLDCISAPNIQELVNEIPTLFITDSNISFNDSYELFSIKPNHLPINEITCFILEKFLNNSIEQFKVRRELFEFENLKLDLQNNKEKIHDLFENSAIGMYEINPDGEFILANKVFLNILGLNNIKELQKFNAFQNSISTNNTRLKLKELLREKDEVNNYEEEWLKADKTKIIVKENLRAKKDYSGKVKYYQGFVEDITDRKNAEIELTERKKDSRKSDQLKSNFLTQISHEVRTPLNTLLSFAELIKDELNSSLTEDLSDSFWYMSKAAKRINRRIDLLGKMFEWQTNSYLPIFNRNNLFDLFEELLLFYKPLADEKNIDLEFIRAIPTANLVFDKPSMTDVFSNIIDNAIKFTMEGSVKIYINKSPQDKIAVTIIDTGIGISEKNLNNIFNTFSQETNRYTRKTDSNGLGLSLVKEYCDLNNAEIYVHSEKGSGSNFTVIFQ